MLSCAIPVSAVISPIKQNTLDAFSFLYLIDIAVPTAIGNTPPTNAEEKILYSGKHKDIDLPCKITSLTFSEGTPFSKH